MGSRIVVHIYRFPTADPYSAVIVPRHPRPPAWLKGNCHPAAVERTRRVTGCNFPVRRPSRSGGPSGQSATDVLCPPSGLRAPSSITAFGQRTAASRARAGARSPNFVPEMGDSAISAKAAINLGPSGVPARASKRPAGPRRGRALGVAATAFAAAHLLRLVDASSIRRRRLQVMRVDQVCVPEFGCSPGEFAERRAPPRSLRPKQPLLP